jgi:hypothetical protein
VCNATLTVLIAVRQRQIQNYQEMATQMSAKELRDNIKEALRKSGALDTVKAQIRREFIESIGSHDKALKGKHQTKDNSIQTRIVLSLIFHFLKEKCWNHSLSVFVAEAGLQMSSVLTYEDILHGLNYGKKSKVMNNLNDQNSERVQPTLLEVLIQESGFHSNVHTLSTSIQTEVTGPTVREALDSQVRELHSSFFTRRESIKLMHSKSVEERMIDFQRECEERIRRDYDGQLSLFRDIEMKKMKMEQEHKSNVMLEQLRQNMENEYQAKLRLNLEREKENLQQINHREKSLEQMNYEARQRVERELLDVRARETAMVRKVDLEMQGLRMLEARLKDAQVVLGSRENEVARKEEELKIANQVMQERAREDAKQSVQIELDTLLRERAMLMIEKQRFDKEREADSSLQMAVADMRRRFREMEEALLLREDEVASLRLNYNRLVASIASDETASKEVIFFSVYIVQCSGNLSYRLSRLYYAY